MDIVFHTHRATVSDHMRARAEQALRKAARRAAHPVDAVIRFKQDGTLRSVELALHTSRGRRFVASSESRFFGLALADAARRLAMQLHHDKRTPRGRGRRARVSRTGAA
jgi:ribosome-associated translation inhibitor RaiA